MEDVRGEVKSQKVSSLHMRIKKPSDIKHFGGGYEHNANQTNANIFQDLRLIFDNMSQMLIMFHFNA